MSNFWRHLQSCTSAECIRGAEPLIPLYILISGLFPGVGSQLPCRESQHCLLYFLAPWWLFQAFLQKRNYICQSKRDFRMAWVWLTRLTTCMHVKKWYISGAAMGTPANMAPSPLQKVSLGTNRNLKHYSYGSRDDHTNDYREKLCPL